MINAIMIAAAILIAGVILTAKEYGSDEPVQIRRLTDTEYRCQKFADETVPTWQPHERYMDTYRACLARNAPAK